MFINLCLQASSYGLYSSSNYDSGFGSGVGSVYVSEKDIQDLGGAQGVEFRNMRSGEKEELKVKVFKFFINGCQLVCF